jgi:hypothetical protein
MICFRTSLTTALKSGAAKDAYQKMFLLAKSLPHPSLGYFLYLCFENLLHLHLNAQTYIRTKLAEVLEKSPSCETDSCLANKEIPSIMWNSSRKSFVGSYPERIRILKASEVFKLLSHTLLQSP